jgi:hypothetical protein
MGNQVSAPEKAPRVGAFFMGDEDESQPRVEGCRGPLKLDLLSVKISHPRSAASAKVS